MAQTATTPRIIFPKKMSFQEFLELNLGEGVHVEWVNGEIHYKHIYEDPITGEITMSVSKLHDNLHIFLLALLTWFVSIKNLGEIHGDQFLMKVGPDSSGRESGREPDITFVATAKRARVKDQYIDGPADLAVEIVSPSSITLDRETKFREYEAGGVPEYWLLDPLIKDALFYQLGVDGKYVLIAPDENGIYHSAVLPGLWIKVEWLWEETRPALADVLKAWQLT